MAALPSKTAADAPLVSNQSIGQSRSVLFFQLPVLVVRPLHIKNRKKRWVPQSITRIGELELVGYSNRVGSVIFSPDSKAVSINFKRDNQVTGSLDRRAAASSWNREEKRNKILSYVMFHSLLSFLQVPFSIWIIGRTRGYQFCMK